MKTQILINGTTQGYIWCKRGLRQGDPLWPLLFALAVGVLSAMFNHAIRSKSLIGVQLNQSNRIYNLQYTDDLIIFAVGGHEDLQIIKINSSSLQRVFWPFNQCSLILAHQPHISLVMILNCNRDCHPVTYLGVSLFGRWPKRQDWVKLIRMVWSRLTP